uniref:Cyclic nucleotide-binding domain-containing protein n=1 Tax=Timema tahoe TaxID=61484 RepID=A0A7R9FGT4_9NEOP|nr:unnamed protein product [Timema tahoe]
MVRCTDHYTMGLFSPKGITLPCDRDHRDVDVITHRLRRVEQLARLPSTVLQQLAYCGYYEDLERGVTLFRQGDLGSSWYAVLGGTLDVRCHDPKDLDEKGTDSVSDMKNLENISLTWASQCEYLGVSHEREHDKNVQLISTLSALPEMFGTGKPIKSQNQTSQISAHAHLTTHALYSQKQADSFVGV